MTGHQKSAQDIYKYSQNMKDLIQNQTYSKAAKYVEIIRES